jgi:hypothetical protein
MKIRADAQTRGMVSILGLEGGSREGLLKVRL